MVAVSVVIPCYQCARTIQRAVDSVVWQTARPEELIMVDDGSGDHTLRLLRRIKHEVRGLFRVRVVALGANHGPSRARNVGWELASQPYVSFLDADDSWHPRKLELQYAWMEKNPDVDVSGHRVELFEYRDPCGVPADSRDLRVKPVSGRHLLTKNPFTSSVVMLRRDLGRRFTEAMRYCEDYLLWSEVVLGGGRAVMINASLALLHKAHYGAGGLSGNLVSMEMGELDTYRRLLAKGLIGPCGWLLASGFSLLRFTRRCCMVALRPWARGKKLQPGSSALHHGASGGLAGVYGKLDQAYNSREGKRSWDVL